MKTVPAEILRQCAHDLRDRISAMRLSYATIQVVVGDTVGLEDVLALLERQFDALNKLADKMDKEAETSA